MFTELQYHAIITRLDELNERIGTFAAQNNPEAYRETPPRTASVIINRHMIDLSEFREKFNGMMWRLLEVIGKEGVSKFSDIEENIKKRTADLTVYSLRTAIKNLTSMGVLHEYSLRIPLTPRTMLYSLTDIGDHIFQDKFFEKPVDSEMARVKREYHSLEHGYGILNIRKVLISSGRYKNVCVSNRENAENAGAQYDYYPDILCVPVSGNYIDYFEYDLGTITPPDLIRKCGKMRNVTSCLNFIIPNRDILFKSVLPKIENLVKSCGHESLKNTIIRLSTPLRLRENNADRNSWWVVYNTRKSLEPTIYKL